MKQFQKKKQRKITDMFVNPGDSNNNKHVTATTRKPPVPFDVFKMYIKDFSSVVSKYKDNVASTSRDNGELRFYRDFYSNPEIQKLHPVTLLPCPLFLKSKILQTPGELTNKSNQQDENEVSSSPNERKQHRHKSEKRRQYPVDYETFKKYLNHEKLMKSVLWVYSNANVKEWRRLYRDKDYYEKILRTYYRSFYKSPEHRNAYAFEFKDPSPEMVEKLLSWPTGSVEDHNKRSENIIKDTNQEEVHDQPETISEERKECEEKPMPVQKESEVKSSLVGSYENTEKVIESAQDNRNEEGFSKANQNFSLSLSSNYDAFMDQAESINERLSFPIAAKKLESFVENLDEILEEIVRESPFLSTEKETRLKIAFHEFYRIFYLFPEFRNFYKCRYKKCPLRVREKFLQTPTNTDYSMILFPVAINTFKEHLNYERVLDKLITTLLGGGNETKSDEKLCQRLFEAYYFSYYLSPHIIRGLFGNNFVEANENINCDLLNLPVLRPNKNLATTSLGLTTLKGTDVAVEEASKGQNNKRLEKEQTSPQERATSVNIMKPSKKISPVLELAERIFFQNVPTHHKIEYLIYTSSELNQSIWEVIDVISYEDFRHITGIYQAEELYDDNLKLRRFYRFVAEQKNWPVNLYIKMSVFMEYFQSKGVPLFEFDLQQISPKLFYWHELLENTNFKECLEYDFRQRKNKTLNDADFNAECERYYNRCWTHNQWISKTPRITDTKLRTQIGTAGRVKSFVSLNCPEVIFAGEPVTQRNQTESGPAKVAAENTENSAPTSESRTALLPEHASSTQQNLATQKNLATQNHPAMQQNLPKEQNLEMQQNLATEENLATHQSLEANITVPAKRSVLDNTCPLSDTTTSKLCVANFVDIQNISCAHSEKESQDFGTDPLQVSGTDKTIDLTISSGSEENFLGIEVKQEDISLLKNVCFVVENDNSKGIKCETLLRSVAVIENDDVLSNDLQMVQFVDEHGQPINISLSSDGPSDGQLILLQMPSTLQAKIETNEMEYNETITTMVETRPTEHIIIKDEDNRNSDKESQTRLSTISACSEAENSTATVDYPSLSRNRPIAIDISCSNSDTSETNNYSMTARKEAKTRQELVFPNSKRRKE